MLKPPLTAAILCLLLLTSDTPAAGMNTMRVHFIDVGQGAATLIQFPCGSVLVDTGGERYPPEEWKSATYDICPSSSSTTANRTDRERWTKPTRSLCEGIRGSR